MVGVPFFFLWRELSFGQYLRWLLSTTFLFFNSLIIPGAINIANKKEVIAEPALLKVRYLKILKPEINSLRG